MYNFWVFLMEEWIGYCWICDFLKKKKKKTHSTDGGGEKFKYLTKMLL